MLGTIEIPDDLPRAESYELNLWVSNWETTLDGIWLREEPDNTWQQYDWVVTVSPETKEGANTMKRCLSLVLAVLLLACVNSFAYAESVSVRVLAGSDHIAEVYQKTYPKPCRPDHQGRS